MAGGGSSSTSSVLATEGFAAATICFVLLLQALTSFIEKKLVRHKHAEDMLRMMYKELMILGIVALLLFVVESGGFHISPNTKHAIEVVHFTLFVVAVFYAVFVAALVALSLWISRHWRIIEGAWLWLWLWLWLLLFCCIVASSCCWRGVGLVLLRRVAGLLLRRVGLPSGCCVCLQSHTPPSSDHDFRSWQQNKALASSLKDQLTDMKWYRKVLHPRLLWTYTRVAEMVNFHEVRFRFVNVNDLPEYFSLVYVPAPVVVFANTHSRVHPVFFSTPHQHVPQESQAARVS